MSTEPDDAYAPPVSHYLDEGICPHCRLKLACGSDDPASSPEAAFREHRRKHYSWGEGLLPDDPEEDPYVLTKSQEIDRIHGEAREKQEERKEEVSRHEVTMYYEAKATVTVYGTNEHSAKRQADDKRLSEGIKPEPTHEVHTEVRELSPITREEYRELDEGPLY